MSTNIVVPELGESIVEARVARWLKKEGDPVAVGEAVVELETDKIDLEVGAAQAGVLGRIERGEGEDVKIGERLGVIDDAKGGAGAAAEAAPAKAAAAAPAKSEPEQTKGPRSAAPTSSRATPTARRIAEEHAVDLSGVRGSGAGGRVTRQDVEGHLGSGAGNQEPEGPEARSQEPEAAEARSPKPEAKRQEPEARSPEPEAKPPAPEARSPKPEADRREERQRMSKRRLTIAKRLVEAQHTAAMLTTFNEIDMSAVQDLRKRKKEAFKARHGVSLGLTAFFVKAAVAALRDFPRINAEIQGEDVVLKHYYDIGIAVGASGGLVVPVLRDADRMSFAAIEQGIREFAKKAEDGTLTLEDLRGGTFTITNGGVFGSLMSTPILNPPQVGILGLHKIEDRVVPRDGQFTIRPMMYVALSYDHRLVDGLEAVQFLVRVKEAIEDPAAMLLEG